MKILLATAFVFSAGLLINIGDIQGENSKLQPCPKSPNCVSSQETKRSKAMAPIQIQGAVGSALEDLEQMMKTYKRATLVEKNESYLHYEFVTKIGKFIDDVEFLIDREAKVIHFRSASRVGFGDFGKNKRRMKMIVRDWDRL